MIGTTPIDFFGTPEYFFTREVAASELVWLWLEGVIRVHAQPLTVVRVM